MRSIDELSETIASESGWTKAMAIVLQKKEGQTKARGAKNGWNWNPKLAFSCSGNTTTSNIDGQLEMGDDLFR